VKDYERVFRDREKSMALTISHLTVRMNYMHPGIKHLSNTYSTGLLGGKLSFYCASRGQERGRDI